MIVLLKKQYTRVEMKVFKPLLLASLMVLISTSINAKTLETFLSDDEYTIGVVVENLAFPKSIEVMPDGNILIAQRDGELVLINKSKEQKRFSITFPELYTKGQGGWLDVMPTNNFDVTSRLLLSYSKGVDDNNKLVVLSGLYSPENGITDLKPVFEVNKAKDTPVHYGAKLLSLGNDTYLVTSGDGFDYREDAQRMTSHMGKVLGFTINGSPLDNPPFPEHPFIFSLGHRNPQGLVKTEKGVIYLNEHGPDGGDEINRVSRGKNYGWPVVTLGVDYSGALISPFNTYTGMEDPLLNWTPSIAPSSMAVYQGNAFPQLNEKFIVTALKAQRAFVISNDGIKMSEQLLLDKVKTRLRDVAIDLNGDILLLTDGEQAKLIRISPTKM